MDESGERAAGGAQETGPDAARPTGFTGVFRESMARLAEEYLLNPARGAVSMQDALRGAGYGHVGDYAGIPVVSDPSVEPGTVEFRCVRQTFRCRLRADEAPVPGQFHVKLRQLLREQLEALASELAHG